MTRFLLRRLAASIVLLFAVVTATFVAIHALPGDPVTLLAGPRPSPETLEGLRQSLGLDGPLLAQFGRWLSAAARGDWGQSIGRGTPAMSYLLGGLRNTAFIAIPALLIQLVFGIGLGVAAGRRSGSALDLAVRSGTVFFYALPIFWSAELARIYLSERWSLLPSGGMHAPGAAASYSQIALHSILPATVLGLAITAHTARLVRNHLVEAYDEDYVRTARAKGASPARVAWLHGLRNTLAPVSQSFGITLALLLSGSVIVETIFSWPGMGRRLFLAVSSRDFPVVLAGTVLTALLVVIGNLIADLLHAAIDPRVRHG